MEIEPKLPAPVAAYIRAVNAHDAPALLAGIAQDAVVKDIGREFRGITAIERWANHEIFAVNVTLDVVGVAEYEGQTIVTAKVVGTFDKTGLPDPLVMDHSFTIVNEKIAALSCRLAGEDPVV